MAEDQDLFNIMKNITSYTGGVIIDNEKKIKLENLKYRELSKIDILKKAIFVFIIQLLNTKLKEYLKFFRVYIKTKGVIFLNPIMKKNIKKFFLVNLYKMIIHSQKKMY